MNNLDYTHKGSQQNQSLIVCGASKRSVLQVDSVPEVDKRTFGNRNDTGRETI